MVSGWTFRDLARVANRGDLDVMVASVLSLVTWACWLRGDGSPLATLDHLAWWLGVDVSQALMNADTWLNADHRREFFIWVCVGVVLVALMVEASRLRRPASFLAAVPRHGSPSVKAGRSQLRFWSVIWISTTLLAVLHMDSWWLVLTGLSVIAVVLANAEFKGHSFALGHRFGPRLPRHVWHLRDDLLGWWLDIWLIDDSVGPGLGIWLMMPLLLPFVVVATLVVPGVDFWLSEETIVSIPPFSVKDISRRKDVFRRDWTPGGYFYFDVAVRGKRKAGRIVFGHPAPTRQGAVERLNAKVALDGRSSVEARLLSAGGLRL